MLERLSRKRVHNIDHFYLWLLPTVSIALIPLCHTRFPKKTECISYVCQDLNFTHMIHS
jgi:beta-lactamase regulating signal transducer with metallopeptidase domain